MSTIHNTSKRAQLKLRRRKENEEQNREITILNDKIKELKDLDPNTLSKFKELPLSRPTLRALKACNYVEPTLVQKLSLPKALMGQDVVVDSKTGTGKTLCFVIPILELLYREKWDPNCGLSVIILNPTGELAYQAQEIIKMLCKHHVFTCAAVIGGKDLIAEQQFIQSINIVICTPGRLLQHLDESTNFDISNLKMLVIDEADQCLSSEFAYQVNAILEALPKSRQTLLFSATQTRNIQDLIRSGLTKPVFISTHEHTKNSTPALLKQNYMICEAHEKLNFLYSFLKNHKKKKILVFLATSKQVKFYAKVLQCAGLATHTVILSMHADMKCNKRIESFNSFLGKQRAVMLATDVAARGLDFADVNWVVQVDCPEDVRAYQHRVGRTARYFRKGDALLLLTASESDAMLKKLESKKMTLEEITVEDSKIVQTESIVEDLLLRDGEQRLLSVAAFTAYLKNTACMQDEEIFNLNTINRHNLAKSYGLLSAPHIELTEKESISNTSSKETVIVAREIIPQDAFNNIFSAELQPRPKLTRKPKHADQEYLKVLTPNYALLKEQDDAATPALGAKVTSVTHSNARKIWLKNLPDDAIVHKKKVKTRKIELLAKREERKHPDRPKNKSRDVVDASDQEDSDGDEQHRAIIDALPEPLSDDDGDDAAEYYGGAGEVHVKRSMAKRKYDCDNDQERSPKIKTSKKLRLQQEKSDKRRTNQSPEQESSDERHIDSGASSAEEEESTNSGSAHEEELTNSGLSGLSLKQQEMLALRLLSGN